MCSEIKCYNLVKRKRQGSEIQDETVISNYFVANGALESQSYSCWSLGKLIAQIPWGQNSKLVLELGLSNSPGMQFRNKEQL